MMARLHLDTFELALRDIRDVGTEKLHALSVAVGWPHREGDWQTLLDLGQGIATVDEIGRVVGTVMWLRYGPDLTMICMLITTPRLQEQGAGRWLMERAHELNGAASRFILTATRDARRLYRSMGYSHEQKILQCQGQVAPSGSAGCKVHGIVRPISFDDHESLLRLDSVASGYDRSAVFRRVLPEATGHALVRNDEIVAFALCRRFGRGHVIGPVIAATEDDAIAVALPHVTAHAGSFLRADALASNAAFTDFLVANGMQIHDTVTSMGLKAVPFQAVDPAGPRRIALVSQALG